MVEMIFKPRDQIAYVPNHAEGDIDHPDVEFGFVTSVKESVIFCRYWSKANPRYLRTLGNSEGALKENIVRHYSSQQSIIDFLYRDLGYPQEGRG